jgi:hypothetical protein
MGIQKYAEQLGAPDIKIHGLQTWIHGRQFPNEDDYWDGNWLRVTTKANKSLDRSAGSVFRNLID